ncbi:hypothetical protein [Ascidiimonas aurantiaca]|uniref:hypothetical protein n=1 Tax=Ascidiimonas aurantiaca TaxID=1685432 RepID=UPI0030ECEABE
MKTKFLIVTLALFTSTVFGQKAVNENYKFPKRELKVAIVPLLNELSRFNDSISNDIFRDTLSLKFLKVAALRNALNEESTTILKKIAAEKYKKKALKKNPKLNTLLSDSDLEYLKKNFQNADLLLFPIIFDVHQTDVMTFGSATFRFYDLNTGDFIHQYETRFNIDTIEYGSLQMVTAMLLLEEKDYLINQVKKQ